MIKPYLLTLFTYDLVLVDGALSNFFLLLPSGAAIASISSQTPTHPALPGQVAKWNCSVILLT